MMLISDELAHKLISHIQEIVGAADLSHLATSSAERARRMKQCHDAARKAADLIKIHTQIRDSE